MSAIRPKSRRSERTGPAPTAPEKSRPARDPDREKAGPVTPHIGAIAPRRGWRSRNGGLTPNVDGGSVYLGTSIQVAGIYPLMQASGLPSEGVPIGPDLLTHEIVCLDPAGWVGHLTTNPGIWIQGQPGAGKSAIAKRICLGLVAYGAGLLCPGDVKGEYSDLVRGLGGQVIRIGRSQDKINPLDAGPLGTHMRTLSPGERDRLIGEVNGRRQEVLQALLATPHGLGRRVNAAEAAAIAVAVRVTGEHLEDDPIVPDILAVLRDPPQELLDRLLVKTPDEYFEQVRPATTALSNLLDGPLAGLFDTATTTPLDLAAPAVSVDLSNLLTAGDQVVAAGLLATWSHTYNAIDTARAFGLLNRSLVLPLDELWRALRAGEGMVDAFDSMSRLNRSRGEISLFITHSLQDLEALPTAADRAKAGGLMERCDLMILAAQPHSELTRIAKQKPLTDAEMDLVNAWASPTATGLDGSSAMHPGRGKYLIKIGQRVGVPVRLALTEAEIRLYDTDARIREAVSRGAGR